MSEQRCRYCGATADLTRFDVRFYDHVEQWAVCRDPYACLERELASESAHRALQAMDRREVQT